MNKYTVYIYAIIVVIAVISSLYKKLKKSNTNVNNQKKPIPKQTTTQYNKPQSTQPKSLEDILQTLLNEQKPQKINPPKVQEQKIFADKQPEKYTVTEDNKTLEKIEKEYYNYDTELDYKEETVDYDKPVDHHVHGFGFDDIKNEIEIEEENEWADIDWRKAIITAEILKRPEY